MTSIKRWFLQFWGRMAKVSILIVLLAFLPVFLTSCGARRDWQRDWLAGKPCSPPCWQGITPGVTTGSQLEAILRAKAPLRTLNVTESLFDPTVALNWEWVGTSGGGLAVYNLDTGLVFDVGFGCSGPCDFTFGEVIDAYGEPSHVLVGALEHGAPTWGTEYRLYVFYIDKGFVLYPYGSAMVKPKINRDLQFGRVQFFVPTIDGFLATVGYAPGWHEALFPWQGFKSFDEYLCLAHPDLCENKGKP